MRRLNSSSTASACCTKHSGRFGEDAMEFQGWGGFLEIIWPSGSQLGLHFRITQGALKKMLGSTQSQLNQNPWGQDPGTKLFLKLPR